MKSAIAVTLATIGLSQCSDSSSYTLYREGVGLPDMRIHVATFDSTDGEDYNKENCRIAAKLFLGQPGVSVRYWCEKRRFHV
jgi:hypothetical protein